MMRTIPILAILAFATPALAAEQPMASPELLGAALQAMQAQRDRAANEAVSVQAELVVARQEMARLRQQIAELSKTPAEPAEKP